MDDDTAGDPCNSLKYTRKSSYKLSEQLELFDFYICANTSRKLMKELGYSLRVNRKIIPEAYHPNRNEQFDIINRKKNKFNTDGYPILSIDTKKKELVGNFKNNGNAWRKHQDDVYIHDFPSYALGKAIPHGLYEPITNKGTVVVGTSHETAEFAVDSIELWLTQIAWKRYQNMEKLLIYCDSGGSNGYRCRAWKYFLYEKICKPYDIEITVCHYPSGASKWNPVEHRMFSFISKNWEGIPLRTYDTVLEYITSTTTKTGLEINAYLNDNEYETGIKIDDKQMKNINIIRDELLPNWNYSIAP